MIAQAQAARRSLQGIKPSTTAALPCLAMHITSWLALGLVTVQRLQQPVPSPFGPLVQRWAWAGIVASIVMLLLVGAAKRFNVFPAISGSGWKAYAMALATGLVLLQVPLFLLVWRSGFYDVPGWTAPFLDKRWLSALFWLAIGTFIVLPSLFARLLDGGDDSPVVAMPEPAGTRSLLQQHQTIVKLAGVLIAFALGCYLAAPPWHIATRIGPVDFHEQAHLGGIQGIRNGYLPYVGAASNIYGPGSQLLIYSVMKFSGHFDIVSFREGFAVLNLVTVLSALMFAAWILGFWEMLLVTAIGVTYSPLGFFRFTTDGTLAGFWGWSNGIRYLGVLVVVPSIALIASKDAGRTSTVWRSAALGLVWGGLSWMSQENLSTTLAATALLLLLLWATDTCELRTVRRVAAGLAAGLAMVWIPLLLYYASHGAALAFVHNYLAGAAARWVGYNNTWWVEAPDNAFRFTTLFLIGAGVLTLFDVRRGLLRRRLDRSQVLLLSFVLVLAACYQTALLRSDGSHLVNTMIALPFVLVLGFRDLPAWTVRTLLGRAALRMVFIAFTLYLYPLDTLIKEPRAAIEQYVFNRRHTPPAISSGTMAAANGQADGRIAVERITPYLADAPSVADGSVSMRLFVEFASDLKQLIGERRTFIEAVPSVYSGLLYFVADLRQGPFLYDMDTMILNDSMRNEWFAHFRSHIGEFECVITADPASAEATIFRGAYPQAAIVERQLGPRRIYVILRDSVAAGGL